MHEIFLAPLKGPTPMPPDPMKNLYGCGIGGDCARFRWPPRSTAQQLAMLSKGNTVRIETVFISIDINGDAKGMIGEAGPKAVIVNGPARTAHSITR